MNPNSRVLHYCLAHLTHPSVISDCHVPQQIKREREREREREAHLPEILKP
jgi:hypothetical protein